MQYTIGDDSGQNKKYQIHGDFGKNVFLVQSSRIRHAKEQGIINETDRYITYLMENFK